ncbi:MAG: Spy/CpxP family protein refolding chaperone [Desulfovibrionaceae bacterium]
MKRKTILSLTAAMALLAMSSLALANPAMHGAGYGRGAGYGMTIPGPAIQLTAEQQGKIQELRDAHFARMDDLRDQFLARHLELESKVNSGKATRSDIEAQLKDMRALRDKMDAERDDFRTKAAAIAGVDPDSFPMGPGFGRGYGRGFGPCGGGCGGFGPGMGMGSGWDDDDAPGMGRGWNR